MDPLAAITVSAVAVFVAEFGDKSQLLILAFATRFPALPVIAGLVLATALLQALSVAVGAAVGAVLPTQLVAVVAGLAFIGVGLWTLRGEDDDDDHAAAGAAEVGRRTALAVVATVASTIALGELGDKTMLVTFGLATTQGPVPTWLGATLGMVGASLIAVAVGRQVGARLDPARIRLVSGGLFIVGGVVVLVGAILGAR
jgi:putative Ca2+/H+ antiporter (TMEM165/GDT1 family)